MGLNELLLMRLVLLGVLLSAFVALATAQAKPDCDDLCGNLNISYPFGLTESCSLSPDFLITCNHSFNPPRPFLRKSKTIKVTNISIQGQVHIEMGMDRDCYNKTGNRIDPTNRLLKLSKFTISKTQNKFTVIGCDSYAFIRGKRDDKNYSSGCMTLCENRESVDPGSCSGSGCCQIEIPSGLYSTNLQARSFKNHINVWDFNPCTYAFIVENGKFNFSFANLADIPKGTKFPVVLDWEIDNYTSKEAENKFNSERVCKGNATSYKPEGMLGYLCKCKDGYEGNPYLSSPDGCQDINECERENNCTENSICNNFDGGYNCTCPKGYQGDGSGQVCVSIGGNQLPLIKIILGVGICFILLLVAGSWLYFVLQRRKLVKLKQEFFKRNGGIILQQKLSGREGTSDTAKIFTAEELKQATNNYDESAIVGKGGYGTVYKGILTDDRVVAIKKSTTVDETQIEQFVNEVVVLSQINHRNVVKLLGCCLETEVPLLVYEFITNGTLFEYIHNINYATALPWGIRLRIAAETAGALSYLHSAASVPIIHRDIKTTNILLDANYTAKVSDFGASRLVPLDETQLSTMVQGTLGYLDPEYLHTSQLTEKSDVYSFGVVLVELLTSRKALCFNQPEEERSLAMYFLSSLKEGNLFGIVDNNNVNQENKEQLEEVARIAKQCLKVKGEERPTMKEVAMELEGLRMMEKHPWVHKNFEEAEYLLGGQSNAFGHADGDTSSAGYDSIRDQVVLSVGGAR